MTQKTIILGIVGLLSMALASVAWGGIADTKHNLSASGPGSVRSDDEDEVCVFCHTPHSAESKTPLWNRSLSNAVYTPYSSDTLQATPGQPTGSSKLCLSCHDGTIALGSVLSRNFSISMTGELRGKALLSTDLSDDHPISFDYGESIFTDDAELRMPHELPPETPLDHLGRMQCSSCHDAHTDKNPDFLSLPVDYSMLCLSCHVPIGWERSAHALSQAAVREPASQGGTVASEGCANCHVQHGGEANQHLLKRAEEEENCLNCHDGSGAGADILSTLNGAYRHDPRSYLGDHVANEDPLSMPTHVECQDCHNPHAANGSGLEPGGSTAGSRGTTVDGALIDRTRHEREVCFRCHGTMGQSNGGGRIVRSADQPDLHRKFDPANPSFHPVVAQGRSADVPSLKHPWTESSTISCGDCHGSDDPNAPKGPHGSSWPGLLEANYETQDGLPESPHSYAMCYTCHDRDNLLADETFPHRTHVETNRASCSACHDPHGVDASTVSDGSGQRLIAFDLEVVTPEAASGRIAFEPSGPRSGSCNLSCHGENHDRKAYFDGRPAPVAP